MKLECPTPETRQTQRVGSALLACLSVLSISATAQTVEHFMRSEKISVSVTTDQTGILGEELTVVPGPSWRMDVRKPASVQSDADFGLEVMVTGWRAPDKQNNADNPALLTRRDFTLDHVGRHDIPGGGKELEFRMKGKEIPLMVRITYRLDPGAFFVRKNIAVSDSSFGHHFLRRLWPVRSLVKGVREVVKAGDFGQPVAILVDDGGGFFGLEYPASENRLEADKSGLSRLSCGQEYGELIGTTWLQSEWAVEAVTPNAFVQNWFFAYIDSIRVVPLRPYTLYNSWYDLRSPEYPQVPPGNVMSESSARRMIGLLTKNMIEAHGIHLDAFVLDDGWDVYGSDWELRKEQFPHGLRPLAAELMTTGTRLGLWLGPTGGYSFRDRRIRWMKDHGYEVVGDQLCVAGKNYGALLRKRVTDFVRKDSVGYFKWDGIQFSCSEPGHGHPIDLYSRRAVMESVIGLSRAARETNPDMFLNITSGTWLSPWWVKYANTIWMDGSDYGYADVPSITRRDAAITYRDFVLYEDFSLKGLWFPVANLMTHGIIKGKLEPLGTPDEPLDKFTDDALLYVARGVSMYELYISPEILSAAEWNSLAASIAWARDRFPVLSTTFMIGGNPMKRETYGYVHFRGSHGIIAARNPSVTAAGLGVQLAPSHGLDPSATSLVVERIYPTKWIAPQLFKAGDQIVLPLDGYESAVYEVFPLEEATGPLLAGVVFDPPTVQGSRQEIVYYDAGPGARLLNPGTVTEISVAGAAVRPDSFAPSPKAVPRFVDGVSVVRGSSPGAFAVSFTLSGAAADTKLAILLTPEDSLAAISRPEIDATIDGVKAGVRCEEQDGRSTWYTMDVKPGAHRAALSAAAKKDWWTGTAAIWIIGQQHQDPNTVVIGLKAGPTERPQPPHPWGPGEVRRTVKLGDVRINIPVVK